MQAHCAQHVGSTDNARRLVVGRCTWLIDWAWFYVCANTI